MANKYKPLVKTKIEPITFYNRYKNQEEFYDNFVRQFDYWFNDTLKIPADKVKRITSLSNNKTVSFESAPDGMLIKATDETSAIKSVAFRVETR